MITASDLQSREAYLIKNCRIVKTGDVFSVQQMDSYFSDSLNPKGEQVNYWSEIKAYKTLNSAIKRLLNEIKCHFPKDYDLSNIKESIIAKI